MKPCKNEDAIRLVLADVDGILVTQEKVLTAKAREAVAKLGEVGIAFAITSGRPPRGMQTLINATVGDMPNDVLMFNKSGMSIAMGNASKEVQAQANFVTDSNEEEGFAHAIERFVLDQTSIS